MSIPDHHSTTNIEANNAWASLGRRALGPSETMCSWFPSVPSQNWTLLHGALSSKVVAESDPDAAAST